MLKSTDLPQGHICVCACVLMCICVFFVSSKERLFLVACCFIYFWARGLNSRASNMLTGSFGALVRWLVSNIIYHQFPFFKFHCASVHTHIQIHIYTEQLFKKRNLGSILWLCSVCVCEQMNCVVSCRSLWMMMAVYCCEILHLL